MNSGLFSDFSIASAILDYSALCLLPRLRTYCLPPTTIHSPSLSPTPHMDPATSASGGSPLQDTSPPMDPEELREIIVRQGALIRSFQDQVEALQSQLRGASAAAPARDPPAARSESPRLALLDKYDGSADRCRGFSGNVRCKALEWASAVWDMDPLIRSSFSYFAGMIREVFQYPAGGKDVSLQLMELRQGFDSVADYAIKFRTLAAQSGWNEAALWAVFRGGLNPTLQTELTCRKEATSLTQFVAMAIHLDNHLRQHQAGAHPPVSARPRMHSDVPRPREEALSLCSWGDQGCQNRNTGDMVG
ncbi:hypothetical protein QTP86_013725 [Hemibagrus guttatus]|nr:hypothetical protein QTP86_013725 [Hemibagrus guttatus]